MSFSPLNDLLVWRLKSRLPLIHSFMESPVEIQRAVWNDLLREGSLSSYGKLHRFDRISSLEAWQNEVPLREYADLWPWIEKGLNGAQRELWPSDIGWYAKSSGTTGAKSKFIPVSNESLEMNHLAGGRDLVALYAHANPAIALFEGLSLRLGGSTKVCEMNANSTYGDLSAIVIQNLPFWAEWRSTPSTEIALLDEWEEKLERITEQVIHQNVTSLFGVPSWMLILMRKIKEKTGVEHLHEVWPNMALFAHGAVNFSPYKSAFSALFPHTNYHTWETYNASEGFFAVQDQMNDPGMLLLLRHGIHYEFIPMSQYKGVDSQTVLLPDVECGETYALVISTCGGLWRYLVGDTVRFVSLYPFRVIVAGRTRLFINAFGEELILDNAETAMARACSDAYGEVIDYTAAPLYMSEGSGAHEWIIEFHKAPASMEAFVVALDRHLQAVNSDYEAKRTGNKILRLPVIHSAPTGFFYDWMKDRGKLGGQNKVPRLSNDRIYMDDLLQRMNRYL